MLKIAIVGNIASGKTTVEEFIKSKGYKVFDTDKIAHKLLAESSEVKKYFGTTDRKELAKIVFSDSQKMKLLESIIHPGVKLELEKIFTLDEQVVFISVPQLFESGFDVLFDKIIYVTADIDTRKQRLMKRNGLSEKEAMMRIEAQKSGNKEQLSDYVIINNSDIEGLRLQVEKVLDLIFVR